MANILTPISCHRVSRLLYGTLLITCMYKYTLLLLIYLAVTFGHNRPRKPTQTHVSRRAVEQGSSVSSATNELYGLSTVPGMGHRFGGPARGSLIRAPSWAGGLMRSTERITLSART